MVPLTFFIYNDILFFFNINVSNDEQREFQCYTVGNTDQMAWYDKKAPAYLKHKTERVLWMVGWYLATRISQPEAPAEYILYIGQRIRLGTLMVCFVTSGFKVIVKTDHTSSFVVDQNNRSWIIKCNLTCLTVTFLLLC